MITNFLTAYIAVRADEGGNDDDPHDHGGRTSRGITQREYDAWCHLTGRPGGDVWEASEEDIQAIYHGQYWQPWCDNLPLGPDYVFFDMCVNEGQLQAAKNLQRALKVKVDGHVGVITLSAAQKADPAKLVGRMCALNRTFYKGLKQFHRYGRGWLNRVDHVERTALKMVNKG